MSVHVAILKKRFADLVLLGKKTIESRITRTAMEPYGAIEPGERLFIKVSGGPYVATAIAVGVDTYDALTPRRIEELERRYDRAVCGGRDYWESKRDDRYAVFIALGEVEPIDVGPRYRVRYMRAWYALDDDASPLIDLKVTAGGLRHGWVYVPASCRLFAEESFRLKMPDGHIVRTSMRGRYFRFRGWRRYFEEHGVEPGDAVRFVSLGGGRYRVAFVHAS